MSELRAVRHLIEHIERSPIVQRHQDRTGGIRDWVAFMNDPSLSSSEERLARLAFRIGRETGAIQFDPDRPSEQQLLDADVIKILAHVDQRTAKCVVEAIWMMYSYASTGRKP